MRQGLDDALTMVSYLSGAQIRAVARSFAVVTAIELDSLQQKRLRRIARHQQASSCQLLTTQWYRYPRTLFR